MYFFSLSISLSFYLSIYLSISLSINLSLYIYLSIYLSHSLVLRLSCRWLYGDFGCQYYAFMGFLMGIANLTTLLIIALDRYLVTCRQDLRKSHDKWRKKLYSCL